LSSIGENVPIKARKNEIFIETFINIGIQHLQKSTKDVQAAINNKIVFVISILGSTKTEIDLSSILIV